jgi:hypothetical protein
MSAAVVSALSRQIRRLPTSLRRSLTWDRGLDMAKHKTFTVATNVKVYFCNPHSPWQRGTNENTNRLLRQYLPKRTDLSSYTQSQLDQIAVGLNQRPRELWDFTRLRANFAQALRRPVELTAETGYAVPGPLDWFELSGRSASDDNDASRRAASHFKSFLIFAAWYFTSKLPLRSATDANQATNQMELGNLTIGWIFG